jgi:hypothetical protein
MSCFTKPYGTVKHLVLILSPVPHTTLLNGLNDSIQGSLLPSQDIGTTIQDLGGGFSDASPLGSLANIKTQKMGANSAVC